ncbi:uncharacterized protein F4817DRAFT_364863 [Daldinia loculata]|uniref:uncharacterized protein n=1 Tax=Daldinia loculata TaxID=103429 RepID=UPI0020C43B5C|nr:uncharacterized protein F4817DRAFT_364863 [Daldinia loculata]KAI1651964.1 hypothetical protein F4817DRAFT_364863 [Daldinia loculata]
MSKARLIKEKIRFAGQNGYIDDVNTVNDDPVSQQVEEYTDERFKSKDPVAKSPPHSPKTTDQPSPGQQKDYPVECLLDK